MVRLVNAISRLVILAMGLLMGGFLLAAIAAASIAKFSPDISDNWFSNYVAWVPLNALPILITLVVTSLVYSLSDALMCTTRRYVVVKTRLISKEDQDELDRRERDKRLRTLEDVGLLTH